MITDLRLALRACLRQPGLLMGVVLPISLVTALSSALFSVVDGLLFRSLPFHKPDELVAIDYRMIGGVPPEIAYEPALLDRRLALRDNVTSRLVLAAQAGYAVFFSEAACQALDIEATAVDSRFFRVIGLQPTLGRDFSEADEQASTILSEASNVPLPVIISHGLWQRLYGGKPEVLGIRELAGRAVNIVGVMGPGVKFPGETNVWAAVRSDRPRPPSYGRLKPETTAEQVGAGLAELEIQSLRSALRPQDSTAAVVLFAAATLLLMVAWVQVAALLLSATLTRITEIGVRLALGASRAQLVRRLVIENGVLAATACLGALLLAQPLTFFVVDRLPAEMTRGKYLSPDIRVFGFACFVSVIGLAFLTWFPLYSFRRVSPRDLLSGRLGQQPTNVKRLRQFILGTQMTVTALLLYVAGLAVVSFVRVSKFDYGVDTEHVLVFTASSASAANVSHADFDARLAERNLRLEETIAALRTLPVVVAAERTRAVPLRRRQSAETEVTHFGGQPVTPTIRVRQTSVGPQFAAALGAQIAEGFSFDHPDYRGVKDLAVVNETLARQLAPISVVGEQQIRGTVLDRQLRTLGRDEYRVIGVVRNLVQTAPALRPDPQLFTLINEGGVIAIRTMGPAESALPAVRAAVDGVWGRTATWQFGYLRDDLREVLVPYRGQSMLLSLIAAFSLPLAAAGLSGALLYFVRVSRRETATRIALGADLARIRREIVRRALTPITIGIFAGSGLGVAAGHLIRARLFQVSPSDPWTIAGVALVLVAIGACSIVIPVRQACRVDPAILLRES